MANSDNAGLEIDLCENVLVSVSAPDVHEVYVGTFGASYVFDCAYDSDCDKMFMSQWTSKDLDFTDQFQQYRNTYFTVERVLLEYIDVDADTPVTVHLSNDGGVNWTTKTLTLGTGDGTQKVADFWLMTGAAAECTGKKFVLRLSSSSTSTRFIWTGINIVFCPRGKYKEVS